MLDLQSEELSLSKSIAFYLKHLLPLFFIYILKRRMRMDPNERIASITALAVLIASNLSDDELGLAAAIFTQLGDTLATIAVQKEINRSRENLSVFKVNR